MKLQQAPNWWSCLPTSFAMVLDIPVQELFKEIGHNGSDLIFPNLEEPYSRRAFHPQEFIMPLLKRGYALMIIEAMPLTTALITEALYPIIFSEGNAVRFMNYMQCFSGVLVGENSGGKPHAVAWNSELYFDPDKPEPVMEMDLNVREFMACVPIMDCKSQSIKKLDLTR